MAENKKQHQQGGSEVLHRIVSHSKEGMKCEPEEGEGVEGNIKKAIESAPIPEPSC